MSNQDFQDVSRLLPRLSDEQLRAVKTKVSALLGTGADIGKPLSESLSDDWLLISLSEELKARGFDVPPLSRLPRTKFYRTYTKDAPRIREWLERVVPNLTKVQRLAFGNVVACCYFRWIDRGQEFGKGYRLSMGTALTMIANLPEALEKGYPGYARSGMLRALVAAEPTNGHARH